jgi:hypothetical protein
MNLLRHIIVFLLIPCSSVFSEPEKSNLIITDVRDCFQSISDIWGSIEGDKKKRIQNKLLSLGLSSTGIIYLVGEYGNIETGSNFHFIQQDLLGSRLFWSVLVELESEEIIVLYRSNDSNT